MADHDVPGVAVAAAFVGSRAPSGRPLRLGRRPPATPRRELNPQRVSFRRRRSTTNSMYSHVPFHRTPAGTIGPRIGPLVEELHDERGLVGLRETLSRRRVGRSERVLHAHLKRAALTVDAWLKSSPALVADCQHAARGDGRHARVVRGPGPPEERFSTKPLLKVAMRGKLLRLPR